MNKDKSKHSAKNNKVKKTIIIIIEIILVGIMIFAGYKIFMWIKENDNNKKMLEQISTKVTVEEVQIDGQKKKKYSVDFAGLKEQNEDTVAWIKVENMRIEYPVVKAEDNSYYLDRSFDKSYNSAGWIFMDYKDKVDGTDKNIVLYGHNRKDGSMFGDLADIFEELWNENKDNMYITFVTENEYCTYQIFSAYRIEDEDYYIKTNFASDEQFDTFINKLKDRSFKDFGVEVSGGDQILTLSTCSNANYRVAVHAKKISNE